VAAALRGRAEVALIGAGGAEEDGVRLLRELGRGLGERVAAGVVGGVADLGFRHLELRAVRRDGAQRLHGLRRDFRADAVAAEDCDVHVKCSP
jgi:hypothetical protein